jgi:tetratricopeptide (TPR) repeat protein
MAERKRQSKASRRLGERYLAQGNPTAALKELLHAEELYAEDPFLQNDLGLAYFGKERLDLAIVHFEKALAFKPGYSEALNNMGAVYLRLEQWDKAIDCFKRALEGVLYANPHRALTNLGSAYAGKKEYGLAIDSYKKALKMEPRYFMAHKRLGLAYMATGDYEAAISSFEKAVEHNPRYAPSYYDLGRAYVGSKYNTRKAISSFKKVVELAPGSPLADEASAQIRRLQR